MIKNGHIEMKFVKLYVDYRKTRSVVPQQLRKRRWLKWGCPVVGCALMLLVVTWPRVITEQLHNSQILNQVLGLTYRGKQANGEVFTLRAPSAQEVGTHQIAFMQPSLETQSIKMRATAATLNVPQMRIDCEGPVEFSHQQVTICTRKAELHLGQTSVGADHAPPAKAPPLA